MKYLSADEYPGEAGIEEPPGRSRCGAGAGISAIGQNRRMTRARLEPAANSKAWRIRGADGVR